jgi:ubiquinone/menaquinone biosynthesis C-methylase UbiE
MKESEEFSFKWFAEQGFYRSVNAYLVDRLDLRPGQKIVELACGTGTVTRMILEKVRGARESLLIGIDSSAASLKVAKEQLSSVKDAALQFFQTRAEQLAEVVRERVDRVVLCNGIHLVPDKELLLAQVSRALKPGGLFAFNTSFFQGAQPPETEQFYRRWMFRALRILRADYALTPQRDRVEARRQLTPEQYAALVQSQGFSIAQQEIKTVPVPLQGWLDISRYEDFIQGALPGVALEQGSQALQRGVTQTFQDLVLETVPRNWLTVVAVKA